MRSKKVTRYYCDHCSRGSLTKPSMIAHEARCFRNPGRYCQLCDRVACVADDIANLNGADLTSIRKSTNDCPSCIMAAIVQAWDGDEDNWISFDYKKELGRWHDDQREASVVSSF